MANPVIKWMVLLLLRTTFVLRAVDADKTYVQIKQCPANIMSDNEGIEGRCTYYIDLNEIEVLQLDCEVQAAMPAVSLRWFDEEGAIVNNTHVVEKDVGNGTDSTATMTWSPGDVRDGMVFTCTAFGEAVGGTASKNVTVAFEDTSSSETLPLWLLIVIIVASVGGLVLIILCGFFLFKRRDRCCKCCSAYDKAPEDEHLLEMRDNLAQMRKKIQQYKPEYVGVIDLRIDELIIGFYGPNSAGKTELVNSLTFALQGRYKAIKKPPGEETTPPVLEEHVLTEHIRIIEDHRTQTFDGTKEEIANKIMGFDEEDGDEADPKEEKVHCPVLVLNLRDPNKVSEESVQASRFSGKVKDLYGPNLRVVITHKLSLEDPHGIATKMSLSSGVAMGDILVVENYTPKSHKEDMEKSLDILNFLWGCLQAGEKNRAKDIRSKTIEKVTAIVGMQAQQRRY